MQIQYCKKIVGGMILTILCVTCINKSKQLTGKSPSENFNIYSIKVDAENSNPIKLSALVDTISYVILESTEESSFGSVDKLIFVNDKIYISDESNTHAIYCFSNTGKFQFKISNRGRGPGEYIGIYDFDVDEPNKLIIIYDREQGAFLEYDFNGNFINRYTTGLCISSFKIIGDGCIVAYSGYSTNPSNSKEPNATIFRLNYRGHNDFLSYTSFDESLSLFLKIFSVFNNISFHNGSVYIYDYFQSSIYELNYEQIKSQIIIDFGKNKIPSDFWETSDILSLSNAISEGKFVGGLENFQIVGKWIIGVTYFGENLIRFFYDRDNSIILQPNQQVMNDIDGFPIVLMPPYHSTNNCLVSLIEPTWLYKIASQNLPNVKIPSVLADIEPNANPILQILRLK
jgi:hypothetical protein